VRVGNSVPFRFLGTAKILVAVHFFGQRTRMAQLTMHHFGVHIGALETAEVPIAVHFFGKRTQISQLTMNHVGVPFSTVASLEIFVAVHFFSHRTRMEPIEVAGPGVLIGFWAAAEIFVTVRLFGQWTWKAYLAMNTIGMSFGSFGAAENCTTLHLLCKRTGIRYPGNPSMFCVEMVLEPPQDGFIRFTVIHSESTVRFICKRAWNALSRVSRLEMCDQPSAERKLECTAKFLCRGAQEFSTLDSMENSGMLQDCVGRGVVLGAKGFEAVEAFDIRTGEVPLSC